MIAGLLVTSPLSHSHSDFPPFAMLLQHSIRPLGRHSSRNLRILSRSHVTRIAPRTLLRPSRPLVWILGGSSIGTLLYVCQSRPVPVQSEALVVESTDIVIKDPKFLQRLVQSIIQSLRLGWRCCEISLYVLPLWLLIPLEFLVDDQDFLYQYLRWALPQLGPSFVKAAQWMATRRDLFSARLCTQLGILHDRVPLRNTKVEKITIEGLIIDESKLLGCGSAGRVWQGTYQGHDVAVKVLHPHFAEQLELDLQLAFTVARCVHTIPPLRMLNAPRVVETLAQTLRPQADLRHEAQHLETFKSHFDGGQVWFPRVFQSTRTVLVEELVQDAVPIRHYLESPNIAVRKELGSLLCRTFFQMVFWDNFVHGDMHPGNILVVQQAKPPSMWDTLTGTIPTSTIPRICLLDAGIAVQLRPNDQRNLLDLFRAVVTNQGTEAGRLMVERAQYERASATPGGVEAFAHGIGDIVQEFHSQKSLTFGKLRVGSLLQRVLDLCRVHGVEIDPNMSSIVVSVLVLEGLARSLDPSLNLMDAAIPFVIGRGKV